MTISYIKYACIILLIGAMCFSCYLLGKSKAEIKIVKEQIEVIKYVTKEKAKIYSKPNATRDELIQLLKSNKL